MIAKIFRLSIFLLLCLLFLFFMACEEDCGDCDKADETKDSDDEQPSSSFHGSGDDDDDDNDSYDDPQVELTEPIPLLNPDGTLLAQGWARTPLIQYNPEYIPANLRHRKKEWDHYTIITPHFAFALTVSDISFATFASYEIIDFETEELTSGVDIRIGSHGTFPPSPLESTYYQHGADYMNIEYDQGTRTITSHIAKSLLAVPFDCDITIDQAPGDENPAVAAPFFDERYFFYENKIFGLPASGYVTVDGKKYQFDPEDSFAVLDWGRGVWPHANEWHWGFAAASVGGKIIGFNIGDGYTDDSLGTANAQKFDGAVHKLYYVYFDYDLPDIMSPWHITSDGDLLNVTLTPFYHQKAGIMILDIGMLVDKMYGTFAGKMTLDDGTVVEFENMFGFIERSAQRW